MVRIYPFNGILPAPQFASQVATRISGSETDEEARLFLQENPLSYLHVIKPHIHFGENRSGSEKHFGFARSYFQQLQEQGVLQESEVPTIYIYAQYLADGHIFTGIVCGVSAIDYLEGSIKKHEYTLTEKEQFMVSHVENTGVAGEPVLLSCPDEDFIRDWIRRNQGLDPVLDFADNQGTRHVVWAVTDENAQAELSRSFRETDSLYIADGHHRIAASTDYLAHMHHEYNWSSKKMFFMAYVLPESDLWINSFHRLVKNIPQEKVDRMLEDATERFNVIPMPGPYTPDRKGEFGLCTRKGWYRLHFLQIADYGSPAKDLDVSRLENYIFKNLLDIQDSKSDSRLQFVRGDVPARDLETLVNSGSIDLAFLVYPNTMAEIKAVADADETMPPKSTWIEPKLLSGMIIQQFTR